MCAWNQNVKCIYLFISEDNAKTQRQPETPPVPTHQEELRSYDAVPVSTSTTTSTIPTPVPASVASESNQTQRVWVTMGLCWGHNAQVMLGKELYCTILYCTVYCTVL